MPDVVDMASAAHHGLFDLWLLALAEARVLEAARNYGWTAKWGPGPHKVRALAEARAALVAAVAEEDEARGIWTARRAEEVAASE